jgi:hypothetical protein
MKSQSTSIVTFKNKKTLKKRTESIILGHFPTKECDDKKLKMSTKSSIRADSLYSNERKDRFGNSIKKGSKGHKIVIETQVNVVEIENHKSENRRWKSRSIDNGPDCNCSIF